MVLQHKLPVGTDDSGARTLLAPLTDPSVPLVRIYTCGELRIEVLQEPACAPAQARYVLATGEHLNGHGISSAYTLLKMLVSASRRCLAKDWIQENWAPTEEDRIPFKRVENAAWYLRGLLCPTSLHGTPRERCRRALLHYSADSSGCGGNYVLGAYPLIWLDVDALDWNIRQACRMERYGDDALPLWERAYHLASQGVYLPDDLYCDWAEPRRTAVTAALRQSVHALKRSYLARYGEPGQAELLRILEDYLVSFPTDEDVLRSLMEVLGGQERFHEVEQWVLRTHHALEEEGQGLDARTLDLWEYLRVKHLQRQRASPASSSGRPLPPETHSHLLPYAPQLSEAITAGVIRALEVLEQNTREASVERREAEKEGKG